MKRLYLLGLWLLCVTASLYAALRMLYAIAFNPARAWRLAIAHDQLANASANGSEDETISTRANRARREGRRWGCILCRVLDVFDKDHCTKSTA